MTTVPQGVILYNGMPDIRVTKMDAGYYQWATIKHAMCSHTLLCEVVKFMNTYGYKFHIENQKPEEEDAYY